MEDEATQPSTQPFIDPRRLGRHHSGLTEDDTVDVICILHPASPAALKAVAGAARHSPQHILQNEELQLEVEGHDDGATRDIALRISAKVKDPSQGFCFGRNQERCDIVLTVEREPKRLSNLHFRIFMNVHGILMLQDMSTNGTYVDDKLLQGKRATPESPGCTTLPNSSIIQLIFPKPEDEIKFIVRIPSREGVEMEYGQNVKNYLARIARTGRQVAAVRRGWHPNGNIRAPIIRPVPDADPRQFANSNSGNKNSGMRWSGAPNYNVVCQIGHGAFATVYKLSRRIDGKPHAVKELEKRKFMKDGILNSKVNNELQIMKRLRHPHIVEYIDHAETKDHLYIIMEMIENGDLLRYTRHPMVESVGQSVSRQILHALDYLHRMKITHRDIKPDNILVKEIDPMVVKLSDFGLSKVVEDDGTFLKTFCGTLLYCAPEVYPDYQRYANGEAVGRRRFGEHAPKSSPYHSSVDMWSFGAVMYHILSGYAPYMGRGENGGALMLRNIMTRDLDVVPLKRCALSDDGIKFLKGLLVRNPDWRPTEAECFAHPWLKHVPDIMEIPDEVKEQDLESVQEEIRRDDDLGLSQISLKEEPTPDLGELELTIIDHRMEDTDAEPMSFETRQDADENRDVPSESDVIYPSLQSFAEQFSEFPSSAITEQQNRLFGEIKHSALESSGVFGATKSKKQQPSDQGLTTKHPNLSGDVLLHSSEVLEDETPSLLDIASSKQNFSRDILLSTHAYQPSEVTSPNSLSSMHPTYNSQSKPPSLLPAQPSDTLPNLKALEMASTRKGKQVKEKVNSKIVFKAISNLGETFIKRPNQDEDRPFKVPKVRRIDLGLSTLADGATWGSDVIVKPITQDKAISKHNGEVTVKTVAARAIDDAKPRYGTLVTEPGSLINTTFELNARLNSFGRGQFNTHQWPNMYDSHVPRYGLQVTFWSPSIENLIAGKRDAEWDEQEDAFAYASTRKDNGAIVINGIPIEKESETKDGLMFGKIYTGDKIELYKGKGKFITFNVNISHGLSSKSRPIDEMPFKPEVEYMQITQMGPMAGPSPPSSNHALGRTVPVGFDPSHNLE
ncbi:MAG: hypothetical protein M1834_005179 [Cirrosporium novae-zelandiae]|nr:MAG: hypothetical protein M1834_005179 [Cirrosporium novae-zelandiae]